MMTTALPYPQWPPPHFHAASPSRIQLSQPSRPHHPSLYIPSRLLPSANAALPSRAPRLLSFVSPLASRSSRSTQPAASPSLYAAAGALTRLRSPNRFVAPLDENDSEEEEDDDDDDDDEDDGSTESEAGPHKGEQEEKVDEAESVVDLSRLLLQLSVQPSQQQQQQQSPLPSSPSAASAVPAARRRSNRFSSPPSNNSSSALLAPTPLESVVVSALQSLQQQCAQQTEDVINDRLDGLEAALSEAVNVSLAASSSSTASLQSVIDSSLAEQSAAYLASRSFISALSSQWEHYHEQQQARFQRRLKELLEEEERVKKEEERRRKAEEEEAIAKEQRRRREEEEERQRREQAAARAAELQREQEERKRKDEEQQKQKQEQEAKQRAQQQQQQQRQQSPSSQSDAASTSSAPPPPSAAQQELQPHVEKLREVRSLSAAYSGPNRVKLKILINRTITQISQTLQSVNSKAIALVSTLRQAQQAGREEYGYVLETMAAKLVSQGETRVRLQLQSAFSFAAVIVHLSVADALFFPVFMATLCERCIYAVPLYLDRRHFPSLAAYMLAMGYEKSAEGLWEEEDAYFERQQGYVALQAAVLQYHSSAPQLHNLSHAWRWLARVLNQEPRTATAAVLYAFLSTAAFALQRVYGAAQVRKLLQYVRAEMVGRMERGAAVKTAARKASVARLVLWLDKALDELRRTGSLSEPEGRTLPQTQEQDTAQLHVNAGDDRGT